MTDAALDVVASFPLCGESYKAILENCFINKKKKSQHELEEELQISEYTLRTRKKEAILLFGLALCNDDKIKNGVMDTATVEG